MNESRCGLAMVVAATRNRGTANRRFAAGRLTVIGKTTLAIDARYATISASLLIEALGEVGRVVDAMPMARVVRRD